MSKQSRIVVKMTDLETGAEQASGELIVIPGFGFCSCTSTGCCSLTSVQDPTLAAAFSAQALKAK
jgi:hypothetical protein